MKPQEFKEEIIDRLSLIRASIIFTFQKETAYWTNNWTSLLSTTLYTLTMLLFLNVIYANTKLVAGYSKNEMLFFFLITQVTFYGSWGIWLTAMREMIIGVNNGDLDLILTKPLPALFYITLRRIKIFSTLRDGLPPILAIIFSINWSTLPLLPVNIFWGILIIALGMICLHVFHLLPSLAVFWLGESKNILKVSQAIESGGKMTPLEGFANNPLRFILGTVAPVLIAGGFAASVMLGKIDGIYMFLWALIVTVVALYIRNLVWQWALRNYSSASS
ncbi:MAG: ABC transporter permease [Patescibacteria group bacterium]|nr:ABC transporter permease [Patescibacteria group bacterium]